MKKLVQEQFLPISIETAWDFFATPNNLNEITPQDMEFEILGDVPQKMYQGMFIRYRISPFLGIKMNWCTEITHVKEGHFFVDEQRLGPYNIWHHEHHFKPVDGGVLMTDILHYDIGFGFLGWIAGKLFVDQKVKHIFDYRRRILDLYKISDFKHKK